MERFGMVLGLGLALVCQVALADTNSPGAVATVSAAELAAIKTDLASLLARVNELEAENAQLRQGQQANQDAVYEIRGAAEDKPATQPGHGFWKRCAR